MRKLGTQLKALREAQGLSYDDVASATHVRPHVIKSMENGTIEDAVAPVYARGFLKTYCEYLMAADLWRKYSLGIPQAEESEDGITEEVEEQIEIKHTTPMFRRSSIIWVYVILVIAIMGAAYLLWSQSRLPGGMNGIFPLNRPAASTDISENTIVISEDETITALLLSGDIVSGEIPSIPVPLSGDTAVSPDSRAIQPGDLSWMDGTSAQVAPVVEIPQFVDRTLLIEITGSNTRLRVDQDGKWVTQRTFGIGGRRAYDVNTDTRVRINAGNRARVTWFGQRYDSIGSDNRDIELIFHPDGSVTLVSGNSPHFTRRTQ